MKLVCCCLCRGSQGLRKVIVNHIVAFVTRHDSRHPFVRILFYAFTPHPVVCSGASSPSFFFFLPFFCRFGFGGARKHARKICRSAPPAINTAEATAIIISFSFSFFRFCFCVASFPSSLPFFGGAFSPHLLLGLSCQPRPCPPCCFLFHKGLYSMQGETCHAF